MFVIQHQEGWSVWIFRPSLTRTTRRRKIDSCLKRVTATDKMNERIEAALCKVRSCCPTDAGKKQRETAYDDRFEYSKYNQGKQLPEAYSSITIS